MTTPICDFVTDYAEKKPIRLHMPGHKGNGIPEQLDITEISGSDVLYDSKGIIRESERNCEALFGSARTVYSTEGSSLCIRAMLYLALMHAKRMGRKPLIAAGRNAHRVFSEAAALLDLPVRWIGCEENLLNCRIEAETLEELFADPDRSPTAVYITSPDYLGNLTPLAPLAEICHRHDALLLTDNAHGAYLRFLPGALHPMDSGADLCCDSAHKTLPVLTGGAYLHASTCCPETLLPMMERAMALFASTSPSWLILQSLDRANTILEDRYYRRALLETAGTLRYMREALTRRGWNPEGTEPMKLTLRPKGMGYRGTELEKLLAEQGMICEFADADYTVMMPGTELGHHRLGLLQSFLMNLPNRPAIEEQPPVRSAQEPVMEMREAMLSPFQRVPVQESLGRILASPSVSCPPAVPICICGERIDSAAIRLFQYYGIETCDVVIRPEE
ncbi:MAG: amino acid decarboxylase [Oscillospiraceae bacterium]|nr:amino acid decarboxylase [Oscillospiraceae bacterium]